MTPLALHIPLHFTTSFSFSTFPLPRRLFFPKRFLSWGFKTLFASASSCQCKPPHFSSPAGLCRVNLDQPRSSGAHKILTELLCPALARARARNSLAATRPRFDFIYTKNFQGGDATENRDFQREKCTCRCSMCILSK